jgi:thiol-disulfide isomerase/thioredoxin
MANILVYVDSILKPYYKVILGVFLLIVFITIARYSYQTFFVKVNQNKDHSNIANANNVKPITTIYFFHVDWCPHCVKAVPEWNAFVEAYNNKEVNGHIVQCYDIDCTDDNGDVTVQFDPTTGLTTNMVPTPVKISKLIEKYNIDSYPTIKLTKDNNVVDFEAKVTKQNLIQFVNSV